MSAINDWHKKTGQHRSLVGYPPEAHLHVMGWLYEQLGWNLREDKTVIE